MTPNQIQFVYFDLDDTLLDHRHAERQALTDVYQYYAHAFIDVTITEIQDTYHALNVSLWKAYADGALTKEQLKEVRFNRLFESLNIDGLDGREVNDRYLEFYARYWRFHGPAQTAFFTISNFYPVGILTNGFLEIQRAKLQRFSTLRERIKVFIISDDVGFMKPHPQFFKIASERARVTPQSILYVGDSFYSDIQGGLDAGWNVAWYTPETSPPQATDDVFRFHQWQMLVDWLLPS